jgi:hypothetical protein
MHQHAEQNFSMADYNQRMRIIGASQGKFVGTKEPPRIQQIPHLAFKRTPYHF